MILFGLLLLVIPFILPIVSLVSLATLRGRVRVLEEALDEQRRVIDELSKRLKETRRATTETVQAVAAETAPPVVRPAAAAPTPPAPKPPPVAAPPAPPPPVVPSAAPPPIAVPTPFSAPAPAAATPASTTPSTATPATTPAPTPPASTPVPPRPVPPRPPPPKPILPREDGEPPTPRPPSMRPPVPPSPPPPPEQPFDWERLIGVKMFSAVAGVALVLAAVFFLKYSIDQGWLGPPIRMAIGILTGIALLVVCELKAARRYPATANAMDAAAIAILFSTFFAAHSLWEPPLIGSALTFGLLGLVTAVAVLLSIRRESMYIAVLGLLGGFATPMLLSSGENRPIPLFAYLMLLNVGLAWVAYRQRWPILTILTLVFTTIYQWGWVMKFLSASQLSLAMGIFLVFAVTGFASLIFSARASEEEEGGTLSHLAIAAAAMPLFFAVYLAAVRGYGASRPGLLFGFLLIVDIGLLAVTLGLRQQLAHALGAVAALLVFAIWLAVSYLPGAWIIGTAFTVAFVVLFALAPMLADRLSRPLEGAAAEAVFAAPALLFVFPVLARIEPASADPLKLFGAMFVLLALLAWRALATETYGLYFIAAFFGLAAEASWSVKYLTADHLREGVILYAAFGVFYLGVPLIARRANRPIEPPWGGGAVLITSLLLLLFLSAGSRPNTALWGLAILLAILDAGIFIESAAGGLPALSAIGGVLSWIVLAVWWENAAASVGLLPSLLFLVFLTLMMLVGHAWAYRQARRTTTGVEPVGFAQGTYLALVGHIFLFFVAVNPVWSVPPWPLFGALAVMTLALSASSLAVHADQLHAAGVIAAAVIVFAWARVAPVVWAPTMVMAAESAAAYALVWIALTRRATRRESGTVAAAAVATLFLVELTVIRASAAETPLPIAVFTALHAVNLSIILALAWVHQWRWVAPAAVIPAWFASSYWQQVHSAPAEWTSSLMLVGVMYVVFTAYPFVLGDRARTSRDPFITAIAGSVLFFFGARAALLQGGYSRFVGAVPVVEAAFMALVLRQLIRLEPPGSRDLGRLALVAATALALVTVAIPLQLKNHWVTIGWALEGAALAWTYRRIPHRGLLTWGSVLLAVVFVRLALNPAVFIYVPRVAHTRIFNWYLYAYMVCSVAMFLAAYWYRETEDRLVDSWPRVSSVLPAGGVILLFLLLNIEIADYYATGTQISFRFGESIQQDLTYTIGWLVFGLLLLTAGIYLNNRPARVTAVALIAVTSFKAFLYDMRSLGGLYRVVSLVGLAVSLSLVALALQRFVLRDSHRDNS